MLKAAHGKRITLALAVMLAGAVMGLASMFETIEAYKRAAAALNVEIYKTDPLEKEIPRERRQTTSLEEIVEQDDPRWLAHQRELDRLSDAECDAECQLASVAPTSIAGILALLEYAVEIEREIGFREIYCDPEEPERKLGLSWYYFANRNIVECLRGLST